MARVPLQRLSVWRLKEGTTLDDALDPSVQGLTPRIFVVEGHQGRYVSRQSPQKPPPWADFIRQGLGNAAPSLFSQSASALLLIEVDNRVFALSFGQSRYWLDRERIDRRFGMMTTLNAVDENSIRSVDREEFEALQRKTRTQTSARSDMGQFGIDVQRDLLRSVTGRPTDEQFAQQVTGADNLIIAARVTFDQLPAKLREIDGYANSTEYRQKGFEWIDHFNRITDPAVINRLDRKLVDDLSDRNLDSVFLAAPSTLDFQDHLGFLLSRENSRNAEKRPDLRIDDWRDRVQDNETITVEMLKKERIRHYKTNENRPSDVFSVYDAIVYETREQNYLYALTGSDWYEIDSGHVQAVESSLMTLPLCAMLLPDAHVGETEGAYNQRVCAASNGQFMLLDANTVSYGGGRSRIEVCDILTQDKKFIHVKAKIKSATLSHLFQQGLVSAQCFTDSRFRAAAKAKCGPTHQALFDGTPVPNDYEVVFAIISTTTGDIRTALPFFSKQSCVNAVANISALGHPVCIMQIRVV